MTADIGLFAAAGRWRLVTGDERVEIGDDPSALLRSHQRGGRRILIGLGGDDVYPVTLGVDDIGGKVDDAAVRYELEQHLPLDAESLATDWHRTGDAVATFSIDADAHRPMLDRLRSEGWRLAGLTATAAAVADEDGPTWWRDGPRVDRIETRRGRLLRWHRGWADASPADGTEIDDASTRIESDDGLHRRLAASLNRPPRLDLLRGPLAEFRDRPRGGGGVGRAAAAALVLGAAAAGTGWYRTSRLRSAAEKLRRDQAAAIADAFPGRRVPAAPLRWLRSETARASANRSAAVPRVGPPAADVLRAAVGALPPGVSLDVDRIDVSDGRLSLGIEVASIADAGRIADALADRGFDVDPPVTDRNDDGRFITRIDGVFDGDDRRE